MIVGHRKQWEFLKNLIKGGKIPHALLFSGAEGLGKKTLAIEFIKLLNCQSIFNGQPCQTCQSCREIEKKIYPDLVLIEPFHSDKRGSAEKKEIRVAQIRELHSRLSLRSLSSHFKAVILDDADSLNQEAQSAFLKLLEEPKGNTLFILIAEHPEMLFPTILSRVEILKFYPLSDNEIKWFLENKGLSKERVREIVSFSWGRPGRAMNFLAEPGELGIYKRRLRELSQLIYSDLIFRFQYVKKISSEGDFKNILDIWLRHFREMLLNKLRVHGSNNPPAELEAGGAAGQAGLRSQDDYSLSKLSRILATVQETQFLLSHTNINPKLALEIIMLEM